MPGQTNFEGDKDLALLEEADAQFYLYSGDLGPIPTKSMKVFYNSKMEINRYITNLAVNTYQTLYSQEDLFALAVMAASGIGAIRMLMECSSIKSMIINDINEEAINLIKQNLELNHLPKNTQNLIVSRKDANLICHELANGILKSTPSDEGFPHIISIDPFGTPNRYLDSAFKCIKRQSGLLCITATDTAVLFGVKPKACLRKYMSKPLHNEFCKEIGARILLYLISRIANINDIGIFPLLTFYSNHFIRPFLLTFTNKKQISQQIKNYGYITYCTNCGYRSIVNDLLISSFDHCEKCGEALSQYAGPLWTGKIHDSHFIEHMISLNNESQFKVKKRVEKHLQFCLDEFGMPPSYYNVHKLCQDLKKESVPKMELLLDKLRQKGYKASRTNFDFTSIKTTMDIESLRNVINDI